MKHNIAHKQSKLMFQKDGTLWLCPDIIQWAPCANVDCMTAIHFMNVTSSCSQNNQTCLTQGVFKNHVMFFIYNNSTNVIYFLLLVKGQSGDPGSPGPPGHPGLPGIIGLTVLMYTQGHLWTDWATTLESMFCCVQKSVKRLAYVSAKCCPNYINELVLMNKESTTIAFLDKHGDQHMLFMLYDFPSIALLTS